MRKLYNRHFLAAEFLIAVISTVGLRLGSRYSPGISELWLTLAGNSQTLYGTLTGLAGALLGFTITGVSIILGLGQLAQLRLIRDSGLMPTVGRVFMQAIMWLAATTVWSLVGLMAAGGGSVGSVLAVGEVGLMLTCGLRLYRCVWVLENMLHAVMQSPASETAGEGAG